MDTAALELQERAEYQKRAVSSLKETAYRWLGMTGAGCCSMVREVPATDDVRRCTGVMEIFSHSATDDEYYTLRWRLLMHLVPSTERLWGTLPRMHRVLEIISEKMVGGKAQQIVRRWEASYHFPFWLFTTNDVKNNLKFGAHYPNAEHATPSLQQRRPPFARNSTPSAMPINQNDGLSGSDPGHKSSAATIMQGPKNEPAKSKRMTGRSNLPQNFTLGKEMARTTSKKSTRGCAITRDSTERQGLETYKDESRIYGEHGGSLEDNVDVLLIFAGVFSAVVTTVVAQT
ncbi:hypothetical protein ARMGADRAFT_1089662 [Armillaria gallica]|uniref:DUF6535 domain-containing protein n=1 Tax=Armillaria gallica TaxID=47427 RepID=A0A2H3D459_ARMGA|nr:hypothetical protein ARMGADRAFT_1089662 [Armillaria gallica]